MPDISLTVATLNELIQTYNGTHPTLVIPGAWLADPTTPISIVISKLITGSRPNAVVNPTNAQFLFAVVSTIPSSISGYNFAIACPTNVVNMQHTTLQQFLEVYNGTRSDLVLPQNALSSPTSYFSLVINNCFAGTAPNAVIRPSVLPYANTNMISIPAATLGFQPMGVIVATNTLQNLLDVYNRQKHDLIIGGSLTNVNSSIAKVVNNCFTGFSPNAVLQPQAVQYANTVIASIPSAVSGISVTPATPTPTDLYLGRFTTVKNDVVNFGGSKLQGVASAVNLTDAVNKANLDSAISTINATIASSSSTDQSYTNTKVAEQASRIDGILSGAGITLDTLKEVSDFANTLHNTQAQDILTKTTTLSNSLDAEVARATLAEAELKKKDEFQTDVLPVVSVYADGEQPSQIPSAIKANPLFTGVDGWYYKNSTATKKANWYVPNVSSLKVSDIVNLTFDATLFSSASPPFIQFYTQKTATGNAGSWYKARTTYSVEDISKVSTYKDYQFSTLKANDTPLPGKTQYALTLDTVGTVGTTSPDDLILAIAIGTNSSATQNSVEFVLDKVRIHTSNGVFAHNFSSFTTELNALSYSLSSTNASLTTSLDTVATNLALEASRASTAETNLANSIADEQTRAENIETDLQNAIHNLSNDLENLTREQADQLFDEIQRAQSAESALSTRCDTLQQQQTVHTGQITQLYTYLFNTAPSVVPIR
jgi:FtsZ-binding cell division protein ZapB